MSKFKIPNWLPFAFFCFLFLVIVGIWASGFFVFERSDGDYLSKQGEFFNIINTLFAGLAFWGLLWAITLQRNELALQREELSLTRAELKKSADAQEKSEAALRKQVNSLLLTAHLNALDSLRANYSAQEEHPHTKAMLAMILARIEEVALSPSKYITDDADLSLSFKEGFLMAFRTALNCFQHRLLDLESKCNRDDPQVYNIYWNDASQAVENIMAELTSLFSTRNDCPDKTFVQHEMERCRDILKNLSEQGTISKIFFQQGKAIAAKFRQIYDHCKGDSIISALDD